MTDYTTILEKPIKLEGDWSVAIVSIYVPKLTITGPITIVVRDSEGNEQTVVNTTGLNEVTTQSLSSLFPTVFRLSRGG